MSNGWQETTLGDILTLEYGKPLPEANRKPSGKYPVYGANGEKGRSNDYYVDWPTIIVGRKGSAGELNLTENKFWPLDVTYFVDYDDKEYDLRFLYYLLQTQELTKLAKGVKPGINRNDVYAIGVKTPGLAEQTRIVAILDEAFSGLDKAKQNAEKNLQNARELFDSYLDSIDAAKEPLGNLVDIRTGKLDANAATPNGRYPFFTCSREIFAIDRFAFDTEAILLAGNNASGDFNVKHYTGKFNAYQRTYVITVPDENRLDYRYLYFQMLKNLKQFKKQSVGANTKFLKLEMIKEMQLALPEISEQKQIVDRLDGLSGQVGRLESVYRRKLAALDELKKSLLHRAFSGELTKTNVIEFPVRIPNITSTDLHAGIIAIAYQRHAEKGQQATFHHVKAEKIVHMAESLIGIELDRHPVKMAAGPNDFPRLKFVESRAAKANFFKVTKKGEIHYYNPGNQFIKLIEKTKSALGEKKDELYGIIDAMVPWDTTKTEILATTFAAWNNLLIDGFDPDDKAIVFEARENWHPNKLEIEGERFFGAIKWMRKKNLIPLGRGRKVIAPLTDKKVKKK
jgi:type I restriction enzyme, S subunit